MTTRPPTAPKFSTACSTCAHGWTEQQPQEHQTPFSSMPGFLEDYPERVFLKYYSFQFDLAVHYYCPEYSDQFTC